MSVDVEEAIKNLRYNYELTQCILEREKASWRALLIMCLAGLLLVIALGICLFVK